jgi:hypothetical protein
LRSFQFLSNRPKRASDDLIVGAQLLSASDNGRQHFEYRDNPLMTVIVFGTFGLPSYPSRLKVDHVMRHRWPSYNFMRCDADPSLEACHRLAAINVIEITGCRYLREVAPEISAFTPGA